MVLLLKTHSHGLQRQALACTSGPRTVRCRPCAAGRKRHVSVRATANPTPPAESGGEAALPASIGGMSTEEEDLVRFGIPAAEIPPPPEPDRFYGVKGFMYATSEGEIGAETTTPPVVFSTVDMAEIKPPPERFEGLGGFKSADGTFIAGDERFIASNTSSGTTDSSKSPEPQKQDKKPEVEQEAVKGLKGYKSVFVAGASGGVGRRVVEALHAEGVPVRALVREYSKGGELPGLSTTTTLVKGDVTQFATLAAAIGDADAVVVATGASGITDPLGPFNVDYQGTLNLIALAKQRGVKKFVMVSSIGTDDILNPLNLFYGVLFWKKRAEEELQRSGLDYTIIRPGGLKNNLRAGEAGGNVVMAPPNTYGVPPLRTAGAILRRQVAEVCVAALGEEAASNKVVEIIADKDAMPRSYEDLFSSVNISM